MKMKLVLIPLLLMSLANQAYSKPAEALYDLAYGSMSEAQKLDLYLPEGSGPFPLLVFIHGGGWFSGDKQDTQEKPWLKLLSHGYAVASVNYRLSGDAPHPAGIQDCKAAIRYLRAHAGDFQIDPERIGVSGGSSGAHYALMVATTLGIPEFDDLSIGYPDISSEVKCCVSWYGGLDLPLIIKDAMGEGWNNSGAQFAIDNCSRYLGKRITSPDDPALEEASPIHYISPGMPPVLLQHGTNDQLAPYNQSVRFYEKAVTIVQPERIEIDLLDGLSHADMRFGTDENMERVSAFLDKYLK